VLCQREKREGKPSISFREGKKKKKEIKEKRNRGKNARMESLP